jgi:hypothetical protein
MTLREGWLCRRALQNAAAGELPSCSASTCSLFLVDERRRRPQKSPRSLATQHKEQTPKNTIWQEETTSTKPTEHPQDYSEFLQKFIKFENFKYENGIRFSDRKWKSLTRKKGLVG